MSIEPAWIAVDWGTSRLRAWAMSDTNQVLGFLENEQGMSKLSPDQFEPTLLDLIAPWRGQAVTRVIACGMVGAKQGWCEIPYAEIPFDLTSLVPQEITTLDSRLAVSIVPGLSQRDPADLMRGEETQLAGLLAQGSDFEGVVCLPGTHTKWCWINKGTVERFHTAMSGELFALFTQYGLLRYSIERGWDDDAFRRAIVETSTSSRDLTLLLFSIRAESILFRSTSAQSRARLSGLIIGSEIGGIIDDILGRPVIVIGSHGLSEHYRTALDHFGADVSLLRGDEAVLKGLALLFQNVRSVGQVESAL
jgi:2-dehydro-3-deoxygalactonokinase